MSYLFPFLHSSSSSFYFTGQGKEVVSFIAQVGKKLRLGVRGAGLRPLRFFVWMRRKKKGKSKSKKRWGGKGGGGASQGGNRKCRQEGKGLQRIPKNDIGQLKQIFFVTAELQIPTKKE